MLGASNLRQQKRLWAALGRPEMAKADNEARTADRDRDREEAVLNDIMLSRTADEWEAYLQSKHVPAARVRRMEEALADPHLASRGVVHRFPDGAPGVPGPFGVPVAAFTLAHGGPQVDSPPPVMGADTGGVLAELGYGAAEIAALKAQNAI